MWHENHRRRLLSFSRNADSQMSSNAAGASSQQVSHAQLAVEWQRVELAVSTLFGLGNSVMFIATLAKGAKNGYRDTWTSLIIYGFASAIFIIVSGLKFCAMRARPVRIRRGDVRASAAPRACAHSLRRHCTEVEALTNSDFQLEELNHEDKVDLCALLCSRHIERFLTQRCGGRRRRRERDDGSAAARAEAVAGSR